MEKRDAPRHRCFLRAFVYLENSATAVDCVVRELSDIGARLQFTKLRDFSEFIDLHIPIKGQNFRSRVQWHRGDEIGVAFHTTTYMNTGEIGLDRRVDILESEIAMLKKAIKALQKNAEPKLEAA
jgi:PilZ domain-containing protein